MVTDIFRTRVYWYPWQLPGPFSGAAPQPVSPQLEQIHGVTLLYYRTSLFLNVTRCLLSQLFYFSRSLWFEALLFSMLIAYPKWFIGSFFPVG